jgi:hypothetical protein
MADTSAPTTVGSAETAPVAVAASTNSPSALKVE